MTAGNLELESYLNEEESAGFAETQAELEADLGGPPLDEEMNDVLANFEKGFRNVPSSLESIDKDNWMPKLDAVAT